MHHISSIPTDLMQITWHYLRYQLHIFTISILQLYQRVQYFARCPTTCGNYQCCPISSPITVSANSTRTKPMASSVFKHIIHFSAVILTGRIKVKHGNLLQLQFCNRINNTGWPTTYCSNQRKMKYIYIESFCQQFLE